MTTQEHLFIKSVTTVKGKLADKNKPIQKGKLIFEDDFKFFDKSKWLRQPNANGHMTEFQWYTTSEENSYVTNGHLHITPTLCNEHFSFSEENVDYSGNIPEECIHHNGTFYPINSARISTCESFAFKYGFVEVMAKIPTGDWLWPAIWLIPRDNVYQDWPRSGEIDMMESRGNKDLKRDGVSIGCDQISSTLHWGPAKGYDDWRLTTGTTFNKSFSSSFHKFQLSWSPEKIAFLIDDKEYECIEPPKGGFWEMGDYENKAKQFDNPWKNGTRLAPFDQEFFIILNVAVGGTTFFSDAAINKGGKPWKNKSPQPNVDFWKGKDQWLPTWNIKTDDSHMVVDYVKVWAM